MDVHLVTLALVLMDEGLPPLASSRTARDFCYATMFARIRGALQTLSCVFFSEEMICYIDRGHQRLLVYIDYFMAIPSTRSCVLKHFLH